MEFCYSQGRVQGGRRRNNSGRGSKCGQVSDFYFGNS
jgi:hypothetical protein